MDYVMFLHVRAARIPHPRCLSLLMRVHDAGALRFCVALGRSADALQTMASVN
jgi:hypothetical protein